MSSRLVVLSSVSFILFTELFVLIIVFFSSKDFAEISYFIAEPFSFVSLILIIAQWNLFITTALKSLLIFTSLLSQYKYVLIQIDSFYSFWIVLVLDMMSDFFFLISVITSWQIDGETVKTVADIFWGGLQNHCRWWVQPWN